MPNYTFECEECKDTVEVEHGLAEPHPETHSDVGTDCSGKLFRVFRPTAVTYRSSGFYTTDKALYGHTPGDYERDDYTG